MMKKAIIKIIMYKIIFKDKIVLKRNKSKKGRHYNIFLIMI